MDTSYMYPQAAASPSSSVRGFLCICLSKRLHKICVYMVRCFADGRICFQGVPGAASATVAGGACCRYALELYVNMKLRHYIEKQEIKLWKDTKDRRNYEDLADLFAIIKVAFASDQLFLRLS